MRRAIIVILAVVSVAAVSGSKWQGCATIQGAWFDNYGYVWSLMQESDGTVWGDVDTDCGTYSVHGFFDDGDFDLLAEKNGPPPGCNDWFEYWGNIEDPACDRGSGGWDSSDGDHGRFSWNKSQCDKPSAEQTNSMGWGTFYPWRTAHDFYQTLTPLGFNFGGRLVTEADAGGGSDGCHFPESEFPPWTSIRQPYPSWFVGTDNRWGPDQIGWHEDAVDYYKIERPERGLPMPCGNQLYQRMSIYCTAGWKPYRVNVLECSIGINWVTSSRDGLEVFRWWP